MLQQPLDMITPSPHARAYRRLGYLAIAHAITLFGLGYVLLSGGSGLENAWRLRLWIALVTLWVLWPVVLALHHGRSTLRFTVFMSLAAIVLFPSLRFYNMTAPDTFGLPMGVSMNPWSMWKYFSEYAAGRAAAKKDLAAGILAMEEYGFGAGGGHHVRILRERYHIEIRPTAGCLVDETILGHAAGYNAVSEPEIDRRFGHASVEAAREEGYKLAEEQRTREAQYFKDLAKRLSSFSSDSKITLESVQPWMGDKREITLEAEEELGQFVRAVERFVQETVAAETRPFDLHVSATLTSTEPPKYETSASLNSPPAYMRIYHDLPALRVPHWSRDRLSVALHFTIREKP